MEKEYDVKRAIDLSDNSLHEMDHDIWSRRSFIKTLGLAGGVGLGLGGFSVNILGSLPLMLATTEGPLDRVLVLIRLKGGNDGLNTIIPLFDYGRYQANRPTIAVKNSDITVLGNGAFGIPKTMNALTNLWNEGAMKVVNSVGYSNHNLSHFTSADIWNSANVAIDFDKDKSGWLGRQILEENPDFLNNLPAKPAAIKVNSGSNIAFQNPDRIDLAVNFNTLDNLITVAETGFLYDTVHLPDNCYYGDQIGFLRSILNVTYKYASPIKDAYSSSSNSVTYSNNDLSRQLAIVARLIKGNLGTKMYMVTMEGFDTHENQNNDHPKLMNNLANALNEFYADLKSANKDNEVLSMTFSEFGRRVSENNGGTDHGTAAPVMLFGPALNGNGFLGKDPDLQDLDLNGNLKHGTDFRSIYATLLESWLCLNPNTVDQILGDYYERMPDIGIDCMNVGANDVFADQSIQHLIRPNNQGGFTVEYFLPRSEHVNVDVFTIMGQKIASLVDGNQQLGKHQVEFNHSNIGLSASMLIYRISCGKKAVSGKFVAAGF